MNNNSVSIAQAARIITKLAADAKSKVLLMGAPGVAKTSVVQQVADNLGKKLVTVILSQKAPEHITGYPYIDNGIMRYAKPDWFPTEPGAVLFIDEIGQCPIAVQNVAMQLIHERRVGPHVLPDDCVVIAAANRAEDRAGSTVLTTTLQSRFTARVTVEPTKQEWIDHAVANEFNPLVIAWVKQQRNGVVEFDPRSKGGFVCPRTLEQAGNNMTLYGNDHENADLVAILYGCLGDAAAADFLAFCETVNNLPSYDDIVSDPTTAKLAPDMVSAISGMIASNAKLRDGERIARYIKRYGAEHQATLIVALSGPIRRHPDIEDIAKEHNLD